MEAVSTLWWIWVFFALPFYVGGMLLLSHQALHYFQLESYQFAGYFKTMKRQLKRLYVPCALYALCCLVCFFIHRTIFDGLHLETISVFLGTLFYALASFSFYLCPAFLLSKQGRKAPQKKPFRKTTRIIRLYCILGLVVAVFAWLGLKIALMPTFCALVPSLLVAFAGVLALPIEKFIQHLYFKDAEKKLMANERLIRIGITGSYGKTSTKFILASILSQKYNVLATPASFNTPMGVTRVIRERLTPAHQVFIGEMGARHVGEIHELCNLVHPTIGILTSVGPQHLDTFGTLERIKNTKYELVKDLPEDGLAVFSDDGDIVTGLYQQTTKPKMLIGALNSDAWAEDVQVGSFGSSFTLRLKGEEPVQCKTKLLGRHNIRNILVSAAVARHLELSMRQIAAGIAMLEPVEHRMQIVSSVGGVTVIDDAFNTNPRSAKEALMVLKSFSGRRIIITPGMVELGAEEEKYNEEFGRFMAACVDIALLVGRHHAQPIKEGLLKEGFSEKSIYMCADLNEAVMLLNDLRQEGDVIMYENDLPDHYSEK